MGRIFVIVGGLLVLILTAALVIPPFVDWTGYRAQFEHEASRILGRPVHVNGAAHARILPFPSVTFTDVTVGDQGDAPLMTIERFYMGAELMPFLRGQILIFDMKVDKPQIHMAFDENGRLDWSLRPDSFFDPAQVSVEKLTVSNGSVDIRDMQTDRRHNIRDLNTIISAKSLKGPWLANGSFDVGNDSVQFDLTTGEVKEDGAIRLRIKTALGKIPAVFDTDGDVKITDGRIGYDGRFNIRTQDLAKASLNSSGNQSENISEKTKKSSKDALPAASTRPLIADLQISGQFEANREALTIEEFRMEQGAAEQPYVVNGKARFDYSKTAFFEIFADGQQLFLGNTQSDMQEGDTKLSLQERLQTFEKVISEIPVPNIPGRIDLKLPAIIAGDTTIRDIMVKAVPAESGWEIEQFAADLPGRTRIEASGILSAAPNFGFSGDVVVASRQPTGLVAWLGGNVDETIRRLGALGFSGKATLKQGQQRIDNLELAVGQTEFRGSFERQLTAGGTPSLSLKLEADQIYDDAAQFWMMPLRKAATHQFENAAFFDNSLINFSIKSGKVHYQDFEFDSLDMAARYANGKVDIDRLTINDLAGATIAATGMLRQENKQLSGILDTTVLSDDLTQFFKFLNHKIPENQLFSALATRGDEYPGLFSDSEINIYGSLLSSGLLNHATADAVDSSAKTSDEISSADTEIAFSLSGKSGGMKLELTGAGQKNTTATNVQKNTQNNASNNATNNALQLQINGSAQSENGETIMALLGISSLPLGIVGPLSADISLQGEPASGMRSALKLQAPDANVDIDGVVSVLHDNITASGKASIQFADAEPFLVTAGYSLPEFGAGLGIELQSDYQFANGILRLPALSGKFGEDNLSGKLDIQKATAEQPVIRGELKLDDIDLLSLSDMMLGTAGAGALGIDNNDQLSSATFAKQPILPLSFDVKVNAVKAYAAGFGIIEPFSARISKQSDLVVIQDITGSWQGGDLTGQLSLRNSEAVAFFNSDLNWNNADLRKIYQTTDGVRPLGGKLNLAIRLNGNGETMDKLVHSFTGVADLNVDDLVIDGLDDASFPFMLHAVDNLVDQSNEERGSQLISEKDYATIAAKIIGQGQFATKLQDAHVTIAGGIARLPVTKLTSPDGILESELQLSLSDLALQGAGSFRFNQAENDAMAPVIQYQISNKLFSPKISFNTNSLIQYLTQRALEREQERVEALQASVIEKQALRRKLELYQSRLKEREDRILEEEARRKEAARRRAESKSKSEGVSEDQPINLPDFNTDAISDLLRELN